MNHGSLVDRLRERLGRAWRRVWRSEGQLPDAHRPDLEHPGWASRYDSLYKNSQLGIFWSTLNGQVLSGNRALLKYLRFDTEEELLEWHAKSFYVDPEQYEHLKALAVEQGLLANYPVALRRADGTTMDALLTVELVREPGWEEPLVAGMVQDITGQREAEEALRTAHANLVALIENTRDFVLFSDREGSPLFYNQAYAQVMKLLLGIEMKPGLKPHELLPDPEGRALWEDYHRRVLDGERFTVEYARRVDNDRTVYLEVAYNPVYVDGEIIGFSEFSRDISQRKQAEIEYQELHDRIQNAQRLESLGVLAGGVAHDFNNLLTPVLSLADLCIQEAPPDSELNARLLAIRQAARRATALANQMLVYAGHSHAELVSVDFAQVIRDMESLLHTTATKRVGIEYQMSDGLFVRCDVTQIQQLILNLVTNASEATGDSRGTIRIEVREERCDRKQLDLFEGGDRLDAGPYVMLSVSDDGPGMEPEVAARVFDPFFTTKATGRGLGLAATRGIVQSHGGAHKIKSAPGEGAEFSFLFPRVFVASTSDHCPDPTAADTWTRPGTILVVDDEEAVAEATTMLLDSLGITVSVALSGEQAIARLRSEPATIDCVLLDLTMPGMDGRETLEALRQIREDLPVILSSGYAEQPVGRPFEDPHTAFLCKPYTLEDLTEKMHQVLSR